MVKSSNETRHRTTFNAFIFPGASWLFYFIVKSFTKTELFIVYLICRDNDPNTFVLLQGISESKIWPENKNTEDVRKEAKLKYVGFG